MTEAANNPFFGKYKTPHETIPFDKIKTEHYEPAFEEGIKQVKQEVDKIANNPAAPTFENTIVALETQRSIAGTCFFRFLQSSQCRKQRRDDGDITTRIAQVVGKLERYYPE